MNPLFTQILNYALHLSKMYKMRYYKASFSAQPYLF